jgi:hypothetical protein
LALPFFISIIEEEDADLCGKEEEEERTSRPTK